MFPGDEKLINKIIIRTFPGELPAEAAVTANVLDNIEKLFDCVNADTTDLRRGKLYATNMKKNSPHLAHFKVMKNFFKNMQFMGCKSKPPTQEDWIWSINGIERLWTTLTKNHNEIKSLATRRLQEDPIENLFGCIRGNCGSNVNPTVGQFVGGLKTAILSNLSHISVGNCKLDENDSVINNCRLLFSNVHNFQFLINSNLTTEEDTEEADRGAILQELEDDIFEQATVDDAELQACAYVCGFIIRNYKNQCSTCKELFIAKETDTTHLFVDFKEYNDMKKV